MEDLTPTQEKILSEIEAGQIVCPQPPSWQHIFKILKEKSPPHVKIKVPLILAGWWASNDYEKNERFKEHLQIAKDLGVLDVVMTYLETLSGSEPLSTPGWYLNSSTELDRLSPEH